MAGTLANGFSAPTGQADPDSSPPEPPTEDLLRLLETDPDSPRAAEALFQLARGTVDLSEAEKRYRVLLERFPAHLLADDALFGLATLHYSLGYHRTAEREFREILDQYADGDRTEDAAYWHGVVLLALGDPDAAMDRFGWLIDRYPASEKSARARIGIGDCFRLKGDLDRARQAYEEVLERFPSADLESAALLRLAEVYERLEQPDKAQGLYSRLWELYPDTPEGVQAACKLPVGAPAEPEGEGEERVEDSGTPAEAPGVAPRQIWTVQVGAFSVEENALRLARVLDARGYRHARVESGTSGSQPLHRVLVGMFPSEEGAGALAKILREQEHLETHVLRRVVEVPAP